MRSRDEPKHSPPSTEPDFDATDGGWDPYVTSLMAGAGVAPDLSDDPEDDGVPVMSFSRTEARRGR